MIILKGKADHVSRPQVRAYLHSSAILLIYHNCTPILPLHVTIKKVVIWNGKEVDGTCLGSVIELRAGMDPEAMLTTCLHEVIHACKEFPPGTVEKCTSTLCARLKPDVARLAHVLLLNTQRRAAYIAHTKIAYRAKGDDHYDYAQNDPIGVISKYLRKRK